jgi:hypothetical protein
MYSGFVLGKGAEAVKNSSIEADISLMHQLMEPHVTASAIFISSAANAFHLNNLPIN